MDYRSKLSAALLGLGAMAALAGTSAPARAAGKIDAVVTIKPVHALVSQVMAGVGEPKLLVTGQASPHTYALKPSDARALNAADVFFRVSESVEPFTRKISASLPASVKVVTLADAPGVSTLAVRRGDTFEAHSHDHEAAHEEAHEEDGEGGHEREDKARADHEDHDGHEGHEGSAQHKDGDHGDGHDEEEHGSRDGHVWLDPENAKAMVAEIVRVLGALSPENAAAFEANGKRVTAELDALEAEIARELEPVKGKPFVVFHDAYQYFERRFGLTAAGSITVSPDVQPSAKRLSEIRAKIRDLGVACVFAEPQFQPNLVDVVIEGSPARSGVLDPEGARVEPGPGAYSALLHNLASGLKSCLHQGS